MRITQNHLNKFYQLITLDRRSLALLRISFGMVIIIDLVIRSQNIEIFYTDEGVMQGNRLFYDALSIHNLMGTTTYIQWLFVLAGVFGVLLIIGFQTRIVTIISWFLLISLHHRNPYVLTAGDLMLGLILFIGIFLPLGSRFSLDSRIIKKDTSNSYFSIWTGAYIYQLVMIYAYAGWAKQSKAWMYGQGIYYSLKIHTYAKSSAEWLLGYPTILTVMNYAVLFLEKLGWIVLLIPKNRDLFRWVAIIGFVGFHIGLSVFMELGIFPMVGVIAWLALIPGSFWDMVLPRSKSDPSLAIKPVGNIWKDLFDFAKDRFYLRFLTQLMGAVFILIVIYGNVEKGGIPHFKIKPFDYLQTKFRIHQGWGVFSGPSRSDGWFVMEAILNDSSQVNLLRPSEYKIWDKPTLVSANYNDHRIRKYSRKLRKGNTWQSTQYTNYLVKKWNDQHSEKEQISRVIFWYMKEECLPDNRYSKVEKIKLYEYQTEDQSLPPQMEDEDILND